MFTVVDTSSDTDTVLGTLEDGGTLTLEDPDSDRHGIRVDTDSNDDIHKVVLKLDGEKDEGKTEWVPPYSLYGDEGEGNLKGENLPAGAYELKATAYDDDGDVLGTLKVSFTVTAGQPAQQPTVVPNTSATGAPSISGMALVGQTLTADTTGIADEDGLTQVVFSYQWMADDANIQGATDRTYTLADRDEGKAIKVTVSFTDAEGNPETLTSDPTGEVAAAPAQNIQATGLPTISGMALVGQTLTADTTGIADEDGLDNAVFSYQWMADDANIQGATDRTYTLADRDEGKTIKVTVSFTDAEGNPETLTSDPTGEVAAAPAQNSSATGAPSISGMALVGQTLTADTTGIADEDGLTQVVFSYQWMADDANIQGATDRTYTLADRDEGKAIKVTVSFTDAEGNPETLTSDPTGEVAAAPAQNIQATGLPTISGMALVGQTLTADTTGIADEDGLDNAVFSYQWMADDANIQGATDRTYTLADRDEGKTIKVTVSFTDAEGNPETLTSDPTGEVAAAPAQNSSATGAPSISGMALVGQTLTADTTGIADEDGLTQVVFSYQWMADDANIQGATDRTYTLADRDEGKAIKVTVSFTDAEGNPETLTSDPTGEVAAAPAQNIQATGLPTISGMALVGQTLTADTTGIADEDGLDNAVFSYQWMADDANIQGATDRTYTLADRDEGKTIKVTVSFTDAEGNPETLTSDPTGEVAAAPAQNSSATGAPSISGMALVGQTLTADTTGIADEDGLTQVVFSYQWMADDANIQGATDRTYTLADRDEGKAIRVIVSFTDDANNKESLPSAATDAVAALPGKPQSLAGEATAQEIKLTWKAPTGSAVVEYVVYRGTLQNGSMNGQALSKYATIDAAGKAMTYTDDNVEEGVEYRYRVAAVNAAGEGKKSTWLDITAE